MTLLSSLASSLIGSPLTSVSVSRASGRPRLAPVATLSASDARDPLLEAAEDDCEAADPTAVEEELTLRPGEEDAYLPGRPAPASLLATDRRGGMELDR